MCWIDECDPAEFYTAHVRSARIAHRCEECSRTIEPGETYESVGMRYEGDWYSFKTCAHCMWARQWLTAVCGGFVHAGVREELEEHWREDVLYRTMELGRRIVLIRSQYVLRGALVPVPTSAPLIPELA